MQFSPRICVPVMEFNVKSGGTIPVVKLYSSAFIQYWINKMHYYRTKNPEFVFPVLPVHLPVYTVLLYTYPELH